MQWQRTFADRFNILALERHAKMVDGNSIYVLARRKQQ